VYFLPKMHQNHWVGSTLLGQQTEKGTTLEKMVQRQKGE